MHWINRKARWPYVAKDVWVTRYWLLQRKIDNQAGATTHSDRRVAAILISFADGGCGGAAPAHLVTALQEVVLNGPDPCSCLPFVPPQEEDLGS